LKLHGDGYAISLLFFSFACLSLGYLIFRSGFLPKTIGALLAYADLLAQMKRYQEAIDVYHTVVEKKPDQAQLQWARLQIVRGWQALKQHDRATVALAELGQTDDALVTRFSSSFHESIKQERQLPQEGLCPC